MQNKSFLLILIMIAFSIVGLANCNPYVITRPTPASHHLPAKISGLSEIWSLANIYTEYADYMPKMIASTGKVMFIGGMSNDEETRLLCLDGTSGKIAWEVVPRHEELGRLSTITPIPDGLYSGYTGVPSVKKLDLSTGDMLWSQSLPGRGLLYIFVIGHDLQISTSLEWFSKLKAESGELIAKEHGRGILISTSQITYTPILMNELQAEETATGKLIWRVSLDRDLRIAPLFTEDIIYLRSGGTMGSAYAIERSTGKILWKTNDVVVSNIALSEQGSMAYMLTRNGELWGVKKDTGEITTLIEFSNPPFVLFGEDIVGGYELAYDQMTRSLYILLGDSRQLFAFKEDE
jgi:outer membrane protein assembly factor BamB